MTRLFLVRHAQSEWNAQGRWQGLADPPLSDAGREEATLAAGSLRGFDGRFISSPLLRARQTAEIIATEVSDGGVVIVHDLHEIDVGEFSGLTQDEIEQRLPEAWIAWKQRRLEAYPGGESRAHFRERVIAALRDIARRHPDEKICCVTHGGAINTLDDMLGVHPGVGVRNLEARWFEVVGDVISAVGDRVKLLPD